MSQRYAMLRDTLVALSKDLTADVGSRWCQRRTEGTAVRLTLITRDGIVRCDSHHEASTMESHLARPEVMGALKTGYGESLRFSQTLGEEMLYGAISVSGGKGVLRGAVALSELRTSLRVFDRYLMIFLGGIAVVVGGLIFWSGRSRAESLAREREEHETLMAAISDAILAVGPDESPLFLNQKFAFLFGEKSSGARGTLTALFSDQRLIEAYREALRIGTSSAVQVESVRGDDGSRYFSVSVSPLRREGEQIYGAVGVFHDVTELKKAERIRIDFVANASHELRTPLTAIKGYADTLAMDLRQGKPLDAEFIEVIARNSDRLIALLNVLLDLSSLESTEALQKEKMETAVITARVLSQMQGGLNAKQREVGVRVEAPTVLADPRRLEQVLVNLLDNANKYTPVEGEIHVAWERSMGEGDVVLSVSDSGPGIPLEHQARLFERFYRVDKGRSRELGGTGLGLSIVKHILQRHGGSVSVESVVGKGSTFRCRFPG